MEEPRRRGSSTSGEKALRNGHSVYEERDRARRQLAGVDCVPAGPCVDVEPVVGELRVEDRNGRLQTADLDLVRVAVDGDPVVAIGSGDDDAVRRAVSGAGRAAEVDLQAREVGSCEVADVDEVRASQGLEVDPFE